MRRLNVQFSQIEECIRTSLFAVDSLPANPPLQPGEELLLQLTKADAENLGKLDRRVEFALIYDHHGQDPDGAISRAHWPNAGKEWKYIIYCSETIPTVPFSLEKLGLSRDYAGIQQMAHILPEDAAKICPYLKDAIPPLELKALAAVDELLAAIRNYDKVVRLSPVRTTRVSEHERRLRDPWLGDALKLLYDHRCQICVHDFKPRYGVPHADTRFLTAIEEGGEPISRNTVVLCPNHDAIIGVIRPSFDQRMLAFRFPNGLVEKLTLRDHLLS